MRKQLSGSDREHVRSPGRIPPVVMWTIGVDGEPGFARTGADTDICPQLLDADNLRDAAVLAQRMHGDADLPVLPILRIDTTGVVPARAELPFAASPGRLARLIADAVRAHVAHGAVIRTAGGARQAHDMLEAVAAHLRAIGLDVAFDIAGWQLREDIPLPAR